MKKIVLATQNKGKLGEFCALFAPLFYEILPLSDFTAECPEETGLTFLENALIKARYAARFTQLPAIGDDSGLIVDALQGAPGIYSARYAGENAGFQAHIAKLLGAMKDIPDEKRTARFHCTLVLMRFPDDQNPLIAQGEWHGHILRSIHGKNGFGYDPIFHVPTHDCSAAELTPELKNTLSHRHRALEKLLKHLTLEQRS